MLQKQHNCGPLASPYQKTLEAEFNVRQEQPPPPANTETAVICLKPNSLLFFFLN